MGCLHDAANIKQNYALNRPIHVQDVCSKFASCLLHRVNNP